jgi:hypothetical protein
VSLPAALHRVPIPRGAEVRVRIGATVGPDDLLAVHRRPGPPVRVPLAATLRMPPAGVSGCLVVRPGAQLNVGDAIARTPEGREARTPLAGLLLGIAASDGAAFVAPLGPEEAVIGHVSGLVRSVEAGAIVVEAPGAMLRGVGGTGDAVHGELVVAVRESTEELRAAAIDAGATGKILVGGSRASAETLTRARAMGVAGIVLGGVLDKELRDFETIQRRRREVGGQHEPFSVLLLEGYGKVGIDPQLFAWLRGHAGRMASLFGAEGMIYVYDAVPPPSRRTLPRLGERVVAHRRPFQGRAGVLVAELPELHATASGLPTRMALVRFEDGRLAPVPVANLEATGPSHEADDGS